MIGFHEGIKAVAAGTVGAMAFISGSLIALAIWLDKSVILLVCHAAITHSPLLVIYLFTTLIIISMGAFLLFNHDKEAS